MKTAVVTGGGSGIGKRSVERLMAQGWNVWALDISTAVLEAQAAEWGDTGRFHFCACDVSSQESVRQAFSSIAKESAKIDALICCAGVLHTGPLEQQSLEQVDRLLDVNLKGPWLCVVQALPLLRKNASPADPSRVVMVGSIGGLRPKVGAGFYGASKAALHVIAGVMAVELGPDGVLVNVVAPGTVETPMVHNLVTASGAAYKPSGNSPLGRVASPDDVSDVIEFFLSASARYVNGTVLPVDGGTRAAFTKS